MLIRKDLDAKPEEMAPGVIKREVVNSNDGAPNFCMRVFTLEPGASTPYHNHGWEHEVYVLEGAGAAVSEKGETPITPDSVVFVPGEEMHCFKNTTDKPMRFICVIPY